jgi:hypothetical protein
VRGAWVLNCVMKWPMSLRLTRGRCCTVCLIWLRCLIYDALGYVGCVPQRTVPLSRQCVMHALGLVDSWCMS